MHLDGKYSRSENIDHVLCIWNIGYNMEVSHWVFHSADPLDLGSPGMRQSAAFDNEPWGLKHSERKNQRKCGKCYQTLKQYRGLQMWNRDTKGGQSPILSWIKNQQLRRHHCKDFTRHNFFFLCTHRCTFPQIYNTECTYQVLLQVSCVVIWYHGSTWSIKFPSGAFEIIIAKSTLLDVLTNPRLGYNYLYLQMYFQSTSVGILFKKVHP